MLFFTLSTPVLAAQPSAEENAAHFEITVNRDGSADFIWNLSGKEELSTIPLITADVSVPEAAKEQEFRIWAHDPLNGTFVKTGAAAARLQVEWVTSSEPVDIRVILPAHCSRVAGYRKTRALRTFCVRAKFT